MLMNLIGEKIIKVLEGGDSDKKDTEQTLWEWIQDNMYLIIIILIVIILICGILFYYNPNIFEVITQYF